MCLGTVVSLVITEVPFVFWLTVAMLATLPGCALESANYLLRCAPCRRSIGTY